MTAPTDTFFVGLVGPAHVGKSTTTAALLERSRNSTGPRWEVRSFASPLYEMVSAMTGRSIEELRRTKDILWTAETAPMPSLVGWSPRRLLKHFGEFARQTISTQVWVERALAPTTSPIVVFDDARHSPEFVVCDLVIELERDGVEYACDHPSAMPPDPEVVALLVKVDAEPRLVAEHIATYVESVLAVARATGKASG